MLRQGVLLWVRLLLLLLLLSLKYLLEKRCLLIEIRLCRLGRGAFHEIAIICELRWEIGIFVACDGRDLVRVVDSDGLIAKSG